MRVKRADGSWIEIGGPGDQVYTWDAPDGTQWHWSIVAATAFAHARNEVEAISLAEMGVTPASLLRLSPDIDVVYALTTDLMRPLLFVPIGDKVRLVDGSHRVMKALMLGVDVLPACFLTQQESDDSLIARVPSGQAVDWQQVTSPVLPAPARTERSTGTGRRR